MGADPHESRRKERQLTQEELMLLVDEYADHAFNDGKSRPDTLHPSSSTEIARRAVVQALQNIMKGLQ